MKVCENCRHVCHCDNEHKISHDCDCESCDCKEEEYCAYTHAMKARLEED